MWSRDLQQRLWEERWLEGLLKWYAGLTLDSEALKMGKNEITAMSGIVWLWN
jgi:hypothetical protein